MIGLSRLAALAAALFPLDAAAEIAVPSGQPVLLQEVLLDEEPGTLWARFRFVAPAIGAEPVDTAVMAADMDHLCAAVALPWLDDNDVVPHRIAVSLADRPTEFGASDPEVTQVFELYRREAAACIWEEF